MITAWDVYWITRLDDIQILFAIMIIALIMVGVVGGVATVAGNLWDEDCWPCVKKLWKRGIVSFFVICLFSIFIPSTKTAVAIYIIPKIASNEQVQKLPDNAMKFINGKFEEWINGMVEKKKSK